MIDSGDLEKKITSVPAMCHQLNGRTCNMDEIQRIADKYKLDIIEDSAQALAQNLKINLLELLALQAHLVSTLLSY